MKSFTPLDGGMNRADPIEIITSKSTIKTSEVVSGLLHEIKHLGVYVC